MKIALIPPEPVDTEALRLTTLALFHTSGVGPKVFQDMLEHYGSIQEIHHAALAKALHEKIQSAWEYAYSQVHLFAAELEERHLNYVCVWESDYPNLLKMVSDPPIILMYRGDLSIVNSAGQRIFSVVGNRNISASGDVVTREVAAYLTQNGNLVVSGMALGVDYVALESAVQFGRAVAVLASSADEPTPRTNTKLYNKILANGGLILSETWPRTTMSAGLFPRRNRIIAGISQATIVVEAAERSGSLITAQQALGYNREVFAVPWSWSHPAQGTNRLIKDNLAQIYLKSDAQVDANVEMLQQLDPQQKIIVQKIASGVSDVDRLSIELALSQTALLSLILDLEMQSIISQGQDGKFYLNK